MYAPYAPYAPYALYALYAYPNFSFLNCKTRTSARGGICLLHGMCKTCDIILYYWELLNTVGIPFNIYRGPDPLNRVVVLVVVVVVVIALVFVPCSFLCVRECRGNVDPRRQI